MKNMILLLMFIFIANKTKAQTIVINEKLLMQMSKNHAVRMASEESFINSYERQRKLYDDVNNKLTKVIAIQEYIYQQLKNVNSALLQSKKLIYLYEYFSKIAENLRKMLLLTKKNPEYAVLTSKYYTYIYEQSALLKVELVEDVLNEDKDYLMDAMDREMLIEKVYTRARNINGSLLYINMRLENAKKVPYLLQVPVLKEYIAIDRQIIREIIHKYGRFLR